MDYLGYISTEGGPLIISDSNALNDWNGIEGNDYKQVCSIFNSDLTLEGFSVNFKDYLPIAWELEGGGIVRVYKNNDKILLIKVWLSEKEFDWRETELITTPISEENINIGNLVINTDFMFIFWATESLNDVEFDNKKEYGIPNGYFAIDDSALYLKTFIKKYSCIHDKVYGNGFLARRLHLIPDNG